MLAPSNDANTCTISGTPTAITSEQAYTITATNQHGDGMVSTNIEVEGVNLSVGAVAGTLVHVIPPPTGYELGVFLPVAVTTASGITISGSYDSTDINMFTVKCDVVTLPRLDFELRIGGQFVAGADPMFSFVAAVTTNGTSFTITNDNDQLFKIMFDKSMVLDQSLINSIRLVCDDTVGNLVSSTIEGQYFPSTTQTTPPGNGYRFSTTITDGDPDSLFSLSDRTGQIRTSKVVPNTPPSYTLTLSNGDRLGFVVMP